MTDPRTFGETTPKGLRPQVNAALRWYQEREGDEFEVTGIARVADALRLREASPQVLELVMCGKGRCELRRFELRGGPDDFEVALLEDAGGQTEGVVPAELDPPPGALRSWLDDKLAAHAFVVLVFYRGLW